MISKRKFFRTVVVVEVLSEDVPVEFDDLAELGHMITNGDCSGRYKLLKSQKLSAKTTAILLRGHGSDPEFFQINDKGEDLEK